MEELIKMLDATLIYESHEIEGEEIRIRVKSGKRAIACPRCGKKSEKVHSEYRRSIQDLPISGKKVIIEITSKKMKCGNPECRQKTFAEGHSFVGTNGKKSVRLEKEILNIAQSSSSKEAARMLNRSTVKISSGTVRNLLKKTESRTSTGKK